MPIELAATIASRPFDGLPWPQWGRRLAADTVDRLASELRQGALLSEPIRMISTRFRATSALSRQSADRLAHTAVMSTANLTRVETTEQAAGDLIKGWRFTATLERHSCLICAAVDGREFCTGDPDMPRPPRHPHCRCTLVPVLRSLGELGIDLQDIPPGTRPATVGKTVSHISADTDYATWFGRQAAAFQREVLGDARYRAYRNGVPLEGFATYDRELTVAELRRLYAEEMADA